MIRGVVFEADAAEQVAQRLRADGYAATVSRERFAGEGDQVPITPLDLPDAPRRRHRD